MSLPWKRLAKQLRLSARLGALQSRRWYTKYTSTHAELERRTVWSNGQIATLTKERDELVRLNESYAKTIGALRVAVETLLLHPNSGLGAGNTHGGPPNASAEPGLTEGRKENE